MNGFPDRAVVTYLPENLSSADIELFGAPPTFIEEYKAPAYIPKGYTETDMRERVSTICRHTLSKKGR